MSKKRSYPPIVPLLAGVALLGLALLMLLIFAMNKDSSRSEGENGAPVISTGEAEVGGPFTLTDQHGKRVSDSDFRGRFMLVYFGFSYCPAICPTRLQTIANALDLLGDQATKVQPLFITIDPERDTPDVLATYVAQFSPNLIGLTGTPAEIKAVAHEAYKVYYAKVEDKDSAGGYTMDHLDLVYLMGPDGKFITFFPPGTLPEQMAARIEQALKAQ